MKRELFAELTDSLAHELADERARSGGASTVGESGGSGDGGGDAGAREKQLEAQLLAFRFLPQREFGAEDPVVPTSVVELEQLGDRPMTFWVLLVPALGGWVSTYRGRPLQILTASSPLGDALLGKKSGDEFALATYRNETRRYRILSHF